RQNEILRPRGGCTLLVAGSVYVLHDALADLLLGSRAVRGLTVGKEKCAWRREQSSGSTRTRASGSLVSMKAARTSSSTSQRSSPTATAAWTRTSGSSSTSRRARRARRPSTSARSDADRRLEPPPVRAVQPGRAVVFLCRQRVQPAGGGRRRRIPPVRRAAR